MADLGRTGAALLKPLLRQVGQGIAARGSGGGGAAAQVRCLSNSSTTGGAFVAAPTKEDSGAGADTSTAALLARGVLSPVFVAQRSGGEVAQGSVAGAVPAQRPTNLLLPQQRSGSSGGDFTGAAAAEVDAAEAEAEAEEAAMAEAAVAAAAAATGAGGGAGAAAAAATETADAAAPLRSKDTLAFQAHTLPGHSRREFAQLVGLEKASEEAGALRIVTVALKTTNDMATWTSQVAEEREAVTKEYHEVAQKAVDALEASGHFADYIDPASGKPQCATKTSGSMLETDDRFTMFGFSVMDFGCCKAISHPTWGTRVMVGAVFTDAPADEVEAVMAALLST